MFSAFSKTKDAVLNIIFPPLCIGCEKHLSGEENLICHNCIKNIKIHNSFFCPVCLARLNEPKLICNHKKEKFGGYPFVLASATDYGNPAVNKLLYFLKYRGFSSSVPILNNILENYLKPFRSFFHENNSVITPVPLHIFKKWQRGFNQAEILSDTASKVLGLKTKKLLKKVKCGKSQARSKSFEKRLENVRGAFEIVDQKEAEGKNIILVDDVFTSGATSKEAIKVLKSAGAKKIIVLVLAKA